MAGPTNRIVECFSDRESRGQEFLQTEKESSKTDIKIQGFAYNKLSKEKHISMAFGSSCILRLIPLLVGFASKRKKLLQKKNYIAEPFRVKKAFVRNRAQPIGIRNRGHSSSWINALMQFIIYIPSLRYMFDFAPKSLIPFTIFMDQYEYDQEFNKLVTDADSGLLEECVNEQFASTNPIEILQLIMQEVKNLAALNGNCFLLALHPEWQIIADDKDASLSLESFVEGFFRDTFPPEFLLEFKWIFGGAREKDFFKPGQFIFLSNSMHYELDAFIEYRPDMHFGGSFVAYVKSEKGVWYQCDDARITLIRSNSLNLVVTRSFLFHYRQMKKTFETDRYMSISNV